VVVTWPVLLTFLTVVLGLLGVCSLLSDLWLADRSRVSERIDEEFRHEQRARIKKSPLFKELGRIAVEAAAEAGSAAPDWRARLELWLEQAGLYLAPEHLVALTVGVGLALGLLAGLVRQSVLVGVCTGLAGLTLPPLFVHWRRRVRRERLLRQLPDAFETMARALRAGQSVSQALQVVAADGRPPLAAEFVCCSEQQNLGLPAEDAFQDLARRTGLLEVQLFVVALVVQQQTGGNLAELLDKLAGLVRERFKLQRKVKTLTAEGRMQANVLLAMPLVVFLIMLLLRRDYVVVLFDNPGLLYATLGLQAAGALWIRWIICRNP
jgi:tight adherence protein B